MLHCVRSVPLDIWRVERFLRFWPSFHSGLLVYLQWSRFLQCMYASVCRSHVLVVLPVFQIFVINMPSLFFLQFVFKNSTSILVFYMVV